MMTQIMKAKKRDIEKEKIQMMTQMMKAKLKQKGKTRRKIKPKIE